MNQPRLGSYCLLSEHYTDSSQATISIFWACAAEPLPVGEAGGSECKEGPNAGRRGSARGPLFGDACGCGGPCWDALGAREAEDRRLQLKGIATEGGSLGTLSELG